MTARASAAERERLLADFVRLCEIESPSRRERAMADAVTAELRAAGLEVEEDASGGETGSDAGNLLARIPGPEGARTILLCAHLDTVPLDAPVEVGSRGRRLPQPQRGDPRGGQQGRGRRDPRASRAGSRAGGRRVGVELLFTTCEERALAGAKAFDRSRLRSEFGFVFDHASPIGELILAAPTYYRLEASFRGAAAHAGHPAGGGAQRDRRRRPGPVGDAARPARRRRPPPTSGVIEGGTAANVVAERCRVELEARSLDDARAGEVVSALVDACTEAASDSECDLETHVEELFRAYRLPRTHPAVETAAARALGGCGIEPVVHHHRAEAATPTPSSRPG